MARGLLTRIIEHGLKQGYWSKGSIIADPFMGIGSTGIIGATYGLRVVGVELEPRFVELCKANIELHRKDWEAMGDPIPVVIQGDSRKFASLVREAVGCVTSPPWADSAAQSASDKDIFAKCEEKWGRTFKGSRAIAERQSYGDSAGQIGSMPEGTVDGCLTSPPYNLPMSQDHPGTRGGARGTTPAEAGAFVKYGCEQGQIEGLPDGSVEACVTSPPYAESITGDHGETETAEESRDKRQTPGGSIGQSCRHGGYGLAEGQIGKLKEGEVDGTITSPPFGDEQPCASQSQASKDYHAFTRGDGTKRDHQMATEGNIAAEGATETYWGAMKQVYAEVFAALKPWGVLACVVKDYVKDHKRVPLCDQTVRLLEHVGFHVFEVTRAMLVKEDRHPSLFGGEEVKTKQRKSFFRRLHEKRPGAVKIDWECVLWARKPA